jgi:hypothetical protein
MAHITLAGVLLDPTGEFSVGDRVRFTHQSTTGNTMRSAVSEIIVPPNGAYSIDLEYGLVLVEYNDYRLGQYRNLGVATVNATNTATSIPELLNAVVPVSSAELIQFQAIQSNCVAAQNSAVTSAAAALVSQNAAAASAATLDLINDLSQTINFDNAAIYKAFTATLPATKRVYLSDRDAYFTVVVGAGSNNGIDNISSDQVSASIQIVFGDTVDAKQLGISTTATSAFNTSVLDRMKVIRTSGGSGDGLPSVIDGGPYAIDADTEYDLYDFVGTGSLTWNTNTFNVGDMSKRLSSIEKLSAKMRKGDTVKIGFYGDSTVRGIGTTGASNPPVTGVAPDFIPVLPVGDLNSYSPDAVPQKFETFARVFYGNNNIICANGGYGGSGLINNFPIQFLEDIFLNNPDTDFNGVTHMFCNWAYNDATFDSGSLETYITNLTNLTKKLRGFGIEPVFMTPDPASNTGAAALLEVKGQLKNALYDVAKKLNIDIVPVGDDLIDFYDKSTMTAWSNDQPDGVHVNSRGHRVKVMSLLKHIGGKEMFIADDEVTNISPVDDRCRGLSKTIGTDSVIQQSKLHFGFRHRIATGNFVADEELSDIWVWCDSAQSVLYHMFGSNAYLDTTLFTEMPKITINNVAVNFDVGTEKIVRTADLGRPTFGPRVEEKPSVITKLRYGLNRIQLNAPDPTKISDGYYNTGYFAVVQGGNISPVNEGKIFDAVGSANTSKVRTPISLQPRHLLPTVGDNGAKHATFPFDQVKSPLTNQILTPDSVCDFRARLIDHTGFTFGGGFNQTLGSYGYAFYLDGSAIRLVRVECDLAGLATVVELANGVVVLADYNDKDVDFRLRGQFSLNNSVGQIISLYRITAGVPVSILSWNSENDAGKPVMSITGWSFGGFWDYVGGSAGEIIQISGGTVYSKIT